MESDRRSNTPSDGLEIAWPTRREDKIAPVHIWYYAGLDGSASTNNFIYSPEHGGIGTLRSWLTYDELARTTNGFSTNNLLGEDGFGCVSNRVVAYGREFSIKQLKAGGRQGEREFRAEVEIISRIHHRYLVSLVDYCIFEHQRLLVYDYVPNGTLHYHLHELRTQKLLLERRRESESREREGEKLQSQ
ncbi:proline-rich receptor-like protein kinase PERK8 [Forsythia ovata]|uniref:non-specific serine/threonine protein kinase n=1 Tax=Forsythia ovata TaxID=205694 RepID=A0ABD1WLF7_9LAMI